MRSVVQIYLGPPVEGVALVGGEDSEAGGCSSAGRAPALHAGGHRFDPVHLHQIIQTVADWSYTYV